MSVQLAAQLAMEDLLHPEKWLLQIKKYFQGNFNYFFTMCYRVTPEEKKSKDSIHVILSDPPVFKHWKYRREKKPTNLYSNISVWKLPFLNRNTDRVKIAFRLLSLSIL